MEIRSLGQRLWGVVLFFVVATSGRLNGRVDTLEFSTFHDKQTILAPEAGEESGIASIRNGVQLDSLRELRDAMDVMQSTWFELWVGAWPTAIDWTGAVINTHLTASLTTLSDALDMPAGAELETFADIENELNLYFGQSIAYYFGENTFAIRNEAYDDMLWVVLGWLEAVKFIKSHSRLHSKLDGKPWHGSQFVAAFAHRSRVFYDIASKGWDTKLCGGGMVWNPSLGPYKNAITNELYISAAAGMYLYFPGDCNDSPFMTGNSCGGSDPAVAHDPKYLRAAIDGYDWLKNSGMINDQGLYTDGFHIKGWGKNGSAGTRKCDERNEAVYTYNQGVLLSGLRALWESTGNQTYLEDGHELIRHTIKATGWILEKDAPPSSESWSGLGRGGIIEDFCDSSRHCNQDGQTFKGIYFHHLSLFCEALPSEPLVPGKSYTAGKDLRSLHYNSCQKYSQWIEHNAEAAIKNRDTYGIFSGWWAAHLQPTEAVSMPKGAVDYRNNATELDTPGWKLSTSGDKETASDLHDSQEGNFGVRGMTDGDRSPWAQRTIETHSGGLAVLRALWELRNMAA
ncbi:glycoside hydrolase family 76 protein, protein [Acrodontium crateriforme]|uniref:Glycoside hydrolase family 76 protein, protein n=1 Tax=Acrodontium crateriforme TaxID=150365 RepID=A0AAQ3M5I4_9PEZI|nr:glycoside hydrolase family 76 protein, protein [Acrodontium crateriforme]